MGDGRPGEFASRWPLAPDRTVNSGASDRTETGGADTAGSLGLLLDHPPEAWRSALDERYSVLDDVLAGRRRAVIYPAARMGREAARRLTSIGVDVVAFGDQDPTLQGGFIDGLPVLSPAEVSANHRGDAILVSSTMHDSAIRENLEARGCASVLPVGYLNLRLPDVFGAREYDGASRAVADPANRADIEAAYSLLGDRESRQVFEGKLGYYLSLDKACLDDIRSASTIYFDRSVYKLGAEEVVVDGGAYVGDTLTSFLGHSAGRFRSYVAFEPDPASFERLAAVAAHDPSRITAVQAGLASATSNARFLGTRGADSRLLRGDESGGEEVLVLGLDEYFERRSAPTLIKMDIEGAEADALRGASRLLRASLPTLAISAYHFPTDLWRIPLLVEKLMPGSRLYLRHYTREVDDTVCYAVPARAAHGQSSG
jgi:FkbM family methyltransferase